MRIYQAALDETLRNATSYLLSERTGGGYWEGELASSALSTATATIALGLYDRENAQETHRDLVRRGIEWLTASQNKDGGWGDTDKSVSNVSTTALCWSALALAQSDHVISEIERACRLAETWLSHYASSIEPDHLKQAIVARYGKDHTFSVPILTVCALAGRLGHGRDAWQRVPQLPFELAASPHQLFKWLRLPVVSYALPALVSMGQARHRHCASRNPILRLIRDLLRTRTLRVVEQMQPQSGGFLEAVPLTSFVVMSLISSCNAKHAVVKHGVRFLENAARSDGSWPIDTNLATWVTTLSVNALGKEPQLDANARTHINDWLLNQQCRKEHPYTHAAPGGWAWTDLPGGVSDADDTAGALLALRNLWTEGGENEKQTLDAVELGVNWLLELQNSDGGIPTFCRGWGHLPFDRSGPDLTAHAVAAWTAWRQHLSRNLSQPTGAAIVRGLKYLASTQRKDGAWIPLWFGNQHAPEEENPAYGTARVLIALSQSDESDVVRSMKTAAVRWLLSVQRSDGGWGGDRDCASSIEETALAVHALAVSGKGVGASSQSITRGISWLIDRTDSGHVFEPSPIGFYFAKLWYYEKLYPAIFAVGALREASQSS